MRCSQLSPNRAISWCWTRSPTQARTKERAGRAEVARALHNDAGAFEAEIIKWRARGGRGRVWIAVESLYSMDGDRAPLEDLMALADRHDGMLFVDEAHATGVYGTDGRGLAASLEGRDNVLVLHTCGKALGGSGALVSGSRVLCNFLINRRRPFIYATAPSPLMAAAAFKALKILKEEPERRERLARLVNLAPYDLRRYPRERPRLRIAVTLNVDQKAIIGLFEALASEQRHKVDHP